MLMMKAIPRNGSDGVQVFALLHGQDFDVQAGPLIGGSVVDLLCSCQCNV